MTKSEAKTTVMTAIAATCVRFMEMERSPRHAEWAAKEKDELLAAAAMLGLNVERIKSAVLDNEIRKLRDKRKKHIAAEAAL